MLEWLEEICEWSREDHERLLEWMAKRRRK